jgi:hypothetical protein
MEDTIVRANSPEFKKCTPLPTELYPLREQLQTRIRKNHIPIYSLKPLYIYISICLDRLYYTCCFFYSYRCLGRNSISMGV